MPRSTVAPAMPSPRPQRLDDRLVERLATVLVGLADEDLKELPLALKLHSVLPSASPTKAANIPSATIPTEFTTGEAHGTVLGELDALVGVGGERGKRAEIPDPEGDPPVGVWEAVAPW